MAKTKTLEELAKEIMAECEKDGEPITEIEAREMAEMELKSKGIKSYTQSETKATTKEKKPRKVDTDKKALFEIIIASLGDKVSNGNLKTETEFNFDYKGSNYTFKLTKHKAK